MREAKLLRVAEIPLADIEVDGRLRRVKEEGVAALIASVGDAGSFRTPIDVRQIAHRDGELRLAAGGYRYAAALAMGWDTIKANVWDCTDDQALMMETDENLARTELSPLELAVFLATKKRVHERLYPETKAGAFKGNQHTQNLVTELSSVTRNATELSSFASSIAKQRGVSERQIFKIVAAGEALAQEELTYLETSAVDPSLKDLIEIGKITKPKLRKGVIDLMHEGSVKNVSEAVAKLGKAKPKPDPIDAAHLALLTQWKRAPKAARQRFVRDAEADLSAALSERQEQFREAAE